MVSNASAPCAQPSAAVTAAPTVAREAKRRVGANESGGPRVGGVRGKGCKAWRFLPPVDQLQLVLYLFELILNGSL